MAIFYSNKNNFAGTITKVYRYFFGEGYPADKYSMVKEMLEDTGIDVTETDGKLSNEDLLLVHSEDLVDSLDCILCKDLDDTVFANSDLPFYSKYPLKSYFTGVSYATHLAARYALRHGYAVNLGGGFHHGKANEAGSCCLINDVAVSIAKLRDEVKKKLKVLIIDLDCHQGDGNAEIFYNDHNTYVFSMHKNGIYPNPEDKQEVSDEDIGFYKRSPKLYFKALNNFLKNFKGFKPDIIYYIAGADTYKEDVWSDGGLGLSMDDLQKRDQIVYKFAREKNIPIVTVLGGGYADVEDVAQIHFNTVQTMIGIT